MYPGFIDTHHHQCFAATYANFPEVRTPPHRTIEHVLAVIAACAECTPEAEWIVLFGYDDMKLAERRKPTRFELDRVAPHHPVLLIHFTYHEGVLNSRGLERSGLARQRHDAPALAHIVADACRRGFSVAIHAAGNEAIELAVAALAACHRAPLPPRIEHFFFVEKQALRRAVSEGIHAVVQPAQLHDTGDLLLQTGLPAGLRYHAYRQMLDAGLVLAGSSDAPVVTFSVMAAIETAVRRRVASGAAFDRAQAITVAEALWMYTRGAAATLGMTGEIGQLTAGARADAVVLSADLERVPAERIGDTGVLATFAGRSELRL